MTRRANARLAGFMCLFYMAVGAAHMTLAARASTGSDTAARLASLAHNASLAGLAILVGLLEALCAFLLGIGLYGLTRDQDRELALLAFACRAGEGILHALWTTKEVALLSIASATTPDPATITVAAVLFNLGLAGATTFCFALGNTTFCYLFVRARSIPVWLGWLGLIGSLAVLVGNALELSGFLRGPVTGYMWVPIAAFQLYLGFWLLITGAPAPPRTEERVA